MKYIFDEWENLKSSLTGRYLFLLLDFDGTLAPIADTPGQAKLPVKTRKNLQSLLSSPRCRLAVISGRMLSDLEQQIGIPGITYVGNHGLEIGGDGVHTESLVTDHYLNDLDSIRRRLKEKMTELQGILIEDKKIIVTLHYRLADYHDAVKAKKIFLDICQPFIERGLIRLQEGKKVMEVRPPVRWNKGDAVLLLLRQWHDQLAPETGLALYAGDDLTDEDAFKAIGESGITIKIGDPKGSQARYFLKSQEEVALWLEQLSSVILSDEGEHS